MKDAVSGIRQIVQSSFQDIEFRPIPFCTFHFEVLQRFDADADAGCLPQLEYRVHQNKYYPLSTAHDKSYTKLIFFSENRK